MKKFFFIFFFIFFLRFFFTEKLFSIQYKYNLYDFNIDIIKELNLTKFDIYKSIYFKSKSFIKEKKDILIFTSKGGGGHIAVANALKTYLQGNYNISLVNYFEQVMANMDIIKTLTFGKMTGEDFYNFCLKYDLIRLVNFYTKLGAWNFRSKKSFYEKITYDFINKFIPKPDMIISVIPMVNQSILNAAKKLNIPFLIITNDLDTTSYINGIENIDYKNFYYTLSFNDNDVIKKIEPAHIPKDNLIFSGFPLRPEFFEKNKDKNKICKDFKLPKNKKKVMILMGAAGSNTTYKYVKALSKYYKPVHLIVCVGRNEHIIKDINKIKLPNHISMSIIGFTNRISDLMYISDVIITKSGPGSICEAIASGLPMIIDKTNNIIRWEHMNIDFVIKYNIGEVITNFRELTQKLDRFLYNKKYIRNIKKNINTLKTKFVFKDKINIILKDIFNKDNSSFYIA